MARRTGRGRDVAAVLAIIVLALMGGALLIATPFLLFVGMRGGDAGGALVARLLVPWLVFGAWCAVVGWLLHRRWPVAALMVALCLFGTLGWVKGQLLDAAAMAHGVTHAK